MDDFDDDLDEIMTQQCFGKATAGDDSSSDSKVDEILLKNRLQALEEENCNLKGEIGLLRKKSSSDVDILKKQRQETELKLHAAIEQYEREIRKLSSELEFKQLELSNQRRFNQIDAGKSAMSTSYGKRSSSTMKEVSLDKNEDTNSYYEFYANMKPQLCVNGCLVNLTDEEKEKRMSFFRKVNKPYSPGMS